MLGTRRRATLNSQQHPARGAASLPERLVDSLERGDALQETVFVSGRPASDEPVEGVAHRCLRRPGVEETDAAAVDLWDGEDSA